MPEYKNAPTEGQGGQEASYEFQNTHHPGALQLTRFTTGKPVTKRVALAADGSIEKKSTATALWEGNVERLRVPDLEKFSIILQRLEPNQALAYGVPSIDRATLMTERRYVDAGRPADAVTRTRRHFAWAAGPGVMMLDYDPPAGGDPHSQEELLAALYSFAPVLADRAHLCRPSAGSCIYHSDTDAQVVGVRGQRIYVPVTDAAAIPEIGKRLHVRGWLAGHGRYDVSKSGALLERGLFDAAVWQPERLDFAAGAVCATPLEQRLPEPQLIGGPAWLRPDEVPALTPEELDEYERMRRSARGRLAPVVLETMERFIDERAAGLAERRGISEDAAKAVLGPAVTDRRLLADFELVTSGGDRVTVGQILDERARWHGARFADPLEPDYHADSRIAYANLWSGGRPYVYSHAHGGQKYLLHRQPRTLVIAGGDQPELADACLDLLRLDGSIVDYGGELAYLVGSRFEPVTPVWLADHLGRLARFERYDGRRKKNVPTDCPERLAKTIIARRGAWGLPAVSSIITLPTLRPDASVLERPGHDTETGLLYLNADALVPAVPSHPKEEQARAAMVEIWRPFRDFPFEKRVDRAVMLAALLTAAVRPSLPTAPGFAFTAPTAGSGKTLLAKCIAHVATGTPPAVMAPSEDEQEIAKSILAVLREGAGAVLWDNVVGQLDSPALAALLTTERYRQRVLGASQILDLPARALFLTSGNNLRIVGDLNRRILTCRIDPGMETPYRREFEVDPLAIVEANRTDLVVAALTLIRYHHTSADGWRAPGRFASFEAWDDLVRQTVAWLAARWSDWSLEDPIEAVDSGFDADPETAKLRALLTAWHDTFGQQWRRIGQIIEHTESPAPAGTASGARAVLREAVFEIAGEGRSVNRRRLGRWVERHEGRRVDGLCFVRGVDRHTKTAKWCVAAEGGSIEAAA